MSIPKLRQYSSASGKWRVVPENAIWVVEVYDVDFEKFCGYTALKLPIIGDSPPHGIELVVNHDEGYYVRLKRRAE